MEQPFSLSQTMLGRVKENEITLGGISKYVDKLLEAVSYTHLRAHET